MNLEKIKSARSIDFIPENFEEIDGLFQYRKGATRLVEPELDVKRIAKDNVATCEREIIVNDKQIIPPTEQLAAIAAEAGISWRSEFDERVSAWWASSDRVDRDGDIVMQNWKLDSFKRNPVILFGHNWGSPPIGAAIMSEVLMRSDSHVQGQSLYLLIVHETADTFEFADSLFRMVDAGFLRTGSVGFMPTRVIVVDDEAERNEIGLGRHGVIFDEPELWEFSLTAMPANMDAHMAAAMKREAKEGHLIPQDLTVLRESFRLQTAEANPDFWEKHDKGLCALWKMCFPGVEMDIPMAFADEPIIDPVKVLSGYVRGQEATKNENPANNETGESTDNQNPESPGPEIDESSETETTSEEATNIKEGDEETPDWARQLIDIITNQNQLLSDIKALVLAGAGTGDDDDDEQERTTNPPTLRGLQSLLEMFEESRK